MILFFSEHPNCRAMCGSCVGHVWVMSGSCLGHVWVTSGSCLGHVCVMSESCLGHVCVMSGSCLGHVWVMSASCVGHVWVMSGSCLGHVWVMSGSRLGHVCVMSGPPIVKTQHLGARGGVGPAGRPAGRSQIRLGLVPRGVQRATEPFFVPRGSNEARVLEDIEDRGSKTFQTEHRG